MSPGPQTTVRARLGGYSFADEVRVLSEMFPAVNNVTGRLDDCTVKVQLDYRVERFAQVLPWASKGEGPDKMALGRNSNEVGIVKGPTQIVMFYDGSSVQQPDNVGPRLPRFRLVD